MSTLFADAPVAAPVDEIRTAPRPTAAPAPVRRTSAYLRAIAGAPVSGPSAYLRAIDPSLGTADSGSSPYLRAIAAVSAR